jgi:hypothetical protein
MLAYRSLFLAFLLFVLSGLAAGDVTIDITSVPACEVPGDVEGSVSAPGVPTDYEIVTYIHVEGSGWWIKPSSADPTVELNPDWTFSVPITDAGLDEYATIYATSVVDAGYVPPDALGLNCLPGDSNFHATDCHERYCHTLPTFGMNRLRDEPCTWGIKNAPAPVGPGDNPFCPENAWVDDQDRLHLAITEQDVGWCSAEVMMTEALGHGTYLFQSSTDVDTLDSKAVFGGFTWDPYGDCDLPDGWQNREIDLTEDTRSDLIPDPDDSQYVVQPWNQTGHRHTYDLDAAEVTRVLVWHEDKVEFYTLAGHHTLDTWESATVLESWTDYGDTVPAAGDARFRLNSWLYPTTGAANTPAGDGELEVVVDYFEFIPEPATVGLLAAGAAAMLSPRRRRRRG